MKKTIELIKQNTYEKKNKKNTIPEALISTKEKHKIKEKPIQRMERYGPKPKNKNFETDRVDTAMLRTGHHCINVLQPK